MADQHANDPLLGTMFQDYVVERLLAQGGMGAVYLCRHVELRHLCKVLKVISTEFIEDPDPSASPLVRANAERAREFLLDRFEREAVAVSRLNHRYIAPIDGISTVGGRRCILMPFLEGSSLEQLLRQRGCLTPHETLHIAAQIARALDYAHHRKIVHRDLKPANVFVVPSEDDPLAIKVIDFGIAKQIHAHTATAWRGPIGTLLFMAVEQFEHASEVTAAADVYSLAVVVYLMITGRYPWGEHHSAFALYRRQMYELPDPAPMMPCGWESLLITALSPDPTQRPQSMRDFVYPLAALLSPDPFAPFPLASSPSALSHKSGREILGAVARRWVEASPNDETLRGPAATSNVWRAAMSGSWPAVTSGSWPATPDFWPVGSWPAAGSQPPAAMSAAWPAAEVSNPSAELPPAAPSLVIGLPAIWKLVLLAAMTAVLTAVVVVAMVVLMRERAQPPQPATAPLGTRPISPAP